MHPQDSWRDFKRGDVKGVECRDCKKWAELIVGEHPDEPDDLGPWQAPPLPPRAAPAPKPKEPDPVNGEDVVLTLGDRVRYDFPVSPTAADVKQLAALVEALESK